MRLILWLAWQDLRRNLKFLLPVLLVLVIGFVGPLSASSLRSSVQRYIHDRARDILSADLVVSSLTPLKENQTSDLQKSLAAPALSKSVEFVTMARTGDKTTFVSVKGVDRFYPLNGQIQLKARDSASVAESLSGQPVAWVDPEILSQLGLEVGDDIELGRARFQVNGVIDDGPGGIGEGMAPKLYIAGEYIGETGLDQFGSQLFYRYYFSLPPGLSSNEASKKVRELFASDEIFIRTPEDSVARLERFFGFFNLYLVVLTMTVFALSWVSAFYVFQVFLRERLPAGAVLRILGAGPGLTLGTVAVEVFVLMLTSMVLAIAMVAAGAEMASHFYGSHFPSGFSLQLGIQECGVFTVVAAASAFAFMIPFTVQVLMAKLVHLLADTSPRGASSWVSVLAMLVIFFGLATWLMSSAVKALYLMGGWLLVVGVGWSLGRLSFFLILRSLRARPGVLRLVATHLARPRLGTTLSFLTLITVALTLNVVPHLMKTMVAELQPVSTGETPSLFLFNVPESSLDKLEKFTSEKNAELRYRAPMVLARLMKVNGHEPVSDQFQRFPVRLTYREQLLPAEAIVRGKEMPPFFDPSSYELPQISMEVRYAERHGFELGDLLEFDVQGFPIQGKIANLRRVKWTEFNPNFFMVFQPGVLDDAPKTFLANIYLPEGGGARVDFQSQLSQGFPELSIVDIGRTIRRVVAIVQDVLWPAQIAAWVAVVMSFFVLIAIMSHSLRLREQDLDIEKLLGADKVILRQMILGEALITAASASLLGSAGAIFLLQQVSVRLLDVPAQISWMALAVAGALIVLVAGVISLLVFERAVSRRGLGF